MGQKVNPVGLRLGINRTWDSRWFASDKEYAGLLHEDLKIRKYLESSAWPRPVLPASSSSVRPRKPASPSIRPVRVW